VVPIGVCSAIGGGVAKPNDSVRTSVMLPGRVHRQVAALAAANDVSTAWIVRQAVIRYLAESVQGELPLAGRK
jgi:hypothetical protein